MDEGYIKYNCNWVKTNPTNIDLKDINHFRKVLFNLNLIGMYENGIGFGNISFRHKNDFLITGSATGGIDNLNENHYTFVTNYNFEKNWLKCEGPIKASSESLTHASVYENCKEANAVVHIHNLKLWEKLLYIVPTTRVEAEYGTPEMAKEITRLFKETSVSEKKIICMAGHKEGIVSFGKSLEEATNIILNHFDIL